jgi:hypothetical protein
MSQYMIADPLALGAQYRLGNHRTTYKPSTTCSFIFLILVLLFAFGIGLAGGVAYFGSNLFIPFPFVLFILFIWLFIVGLILYGLVETYRNRVLRVFVYDYGLIHVGREFHQSIYWQNVEAVWHNVEKHTSTDSKGHSTTTYIHTYTVRCIDGTQLKLDRTFARLQQLGKSIEVGTAPYIFPRVLKVYQMSQAVVFGPLTVAPWGLSYGGKTLPWTEMKSIKIDENYGLIAIKKQGKLFGWASVALSDLPNVEVFRMLVQHITGLRI